MKKSMILLFFGLIGTVFANCVDDARLSFRTTGPDRYADGTVVLDGECYALVWSKDGDFDGFDANGDCVDPEDRIVLVAPLAKGGRCPPVLFQIPAAEAKADNIIQKAEAQKASRINEANGQAARFNAEYSE
jgi:hypothetical protein